ncbi:ferrochelatase-2, chloroplastic isoform X1 [Selaginella moellendorffii]|nr:ferrochelatase-2, chloroplastic isoform X1 [Selaginella moellendorffii]|eukprot:XP_002961149.2 ferrochelatase-2, chloroplastic isoform X1 [Selaginella moellendorffii]
MQQQIEFAIHPCERPRQWNRIGEVSCRRQAKAGPSVLILGDHACKYGSLSQASRRSQKSAWKLMTKATVDVGPLMSETRQPLALPQDEKVGVLLLNLGGPDSLEDVQPFLFNLFSDPDIIRLPRLFRFLQKPLAEFISAARAPKSAEGYASIGGGSPLRRITEEQARLDPRILLVTVFSFSQARALQKSLETKHLPATVYVGMRYWHPFTEEAIEQIKKDRITRLVVLPLYPQFSISTSGSSLRLLESIFRSDEYLVNMQHTVIPSWYQREGYVKAMASLIEKEFSKFPNPEDVHIFFSAHGVPVAYVEEAGDPYKAEMEECVDLIMSELRSRGVKNVHSLAYQSRVGPVEWLKPYTDVKIKELGQNGIKSLLAVPISFVSEHIETLEEIDMEYKELALESGIVHWGRVPALNCDSTFITDLADAVIEALPYVGAMAVSNLEARQALVPLGSVGELLATYDTQRRELPAPVAVWEWGWTKSAETWNGRVAMLAVLVLLVLEIASGKGLLHQWGILPS